MIGGLDQLASPPKPEQIAALKEASESISWHLGGEVRYSA